MPFSHLRDRAIHDVLFRTVADYTYDWESWHDPLGKPVWVNASVQRMTGFGVDECLKMVDYPLPIVLAEDRPRIRQMLDEAIAKRSYNDLEFRIRTRGGEIRWMAVSWQPMYCDEGQHLGFRTSVRDITDRQSLKNQLRIYTEHLEQLVQERTAQIAQLESHRQQMEKLAALGELAAGVAHEINNPLAGIRNAFALIKTSLPADHEHYDLLGLVDDEIGRVSSIIHQMYQLYRRVPQASTEVVLEKTLQDVVCLLEPISRRYQVAISLEPLSNKPLGYLTKVYLPEGELKQVLFNLIRNAIQASSPNQVVKVSVQLNDQLEIRVQDYGSGIADDVLPQIFDPFFSTKSQIKEGMGLGLSVSRSLIESMGGKITVETAVGFGTTFTVTLPLVTVSP